MHSLHPVIDRPEGRPAWCVPSALSALTGAPYATCAEACVRNGAAETYLDLEGVDLTIVLLALRELWPTATVEQIDLAARYPKLKCGPHLHRYMQERSADEIVFPCLIGVNNHMIVSHAGFLGGNDVEAPCPWSFFPKLGRFVNWVGMVWK